MPHLRATGNRFHPGAHVGRIGGIGSLVRGKTVAIKINLTGRAELLLGRLPVETTSWTHPTVIAAAMHLMDKAGAKCIRLLESPWSSDEPLEEFIQCPFASRWCGQ